MNAVVKALRAARQARRLTTLAVAGWAALMVSASALADNARTINVVAAENFYGDVVSQLGGKRVAVTSILSNPDEDPHLFEASPKTARALQRADIVVYNGAGYDPWMDKLLAASKNGKRTIIVAAELVGKKPGDNPHLWYAPQTMPAVARAVAKALEQTDPANKAEYGASLARFLDSLKAIDEKVAALRTKYQGTPVTATEPVFGYMSDAIGLAMRNPRFQLSIMNDTEPSAADVAAFEKDLRTRQVRVLIYNGQATGAISQRMLKLAQQSHVPTVSVTETEPARRNFQQWMTSQLDELSAALELKH
jgi:zinc/manganese transport system substrate-binding protein